MKTDVLVLCPDTVYPPTHGAAARTLGVAKLLPGHVEIVAQGQESREDRFESLNVRHEALPHGLRQVSRLGSMLIGRNLGHRLSPQTRKESRGAIVQLESPLLYAAAKRAEQQALVLNAHNVYAELSEFPQRRWQDRLYYRVTRTRQAQMERTCWRGADRIIFCSERDRHVAMGIEQSVERKSIVVPNCVDVSAFGPAPTPSATRIVFIGTTKYPPNYEAVRRICEGIAPVLPQLTFDIVGSAPIRPPSIPPNVRFLGVVPSTSEILRETRIAIAPLDYGSGTRLKILEYLASGVSIVASPKAVEGLDLLPDVHYLEAKTDSDFVSQIRAIESSSNVGREIGLHARSLASDKYDWEAYRDAIRELYAPLRQATVR